MGLKETVEGAKQRAQEKIGEKITEEDIMKALDICYQKCISGVSKAIPSVDKLASDYISKTPNGASNAEKAAKNMQKVQIAKCTTSGIITGFGGIISLPVAIPANVGSVLYVQMRMIACTARMAGYDLDSDQVQTLVYACLAGLSISELLKGTGIKIGEKLALGAIKKIPVDVIKRINKAVGFRLLTKFGEKGIINLGKLIPGVGAVVNGGFDLVETAIIADRANKMFFKGDFSVSENEVDIIDIEAEIVE